MIFFRRFDDQVDDSRETATATATLLHGMIDFRWDDELPTVFIKKLVDDIANVVVGDVIAAANQHDPLPA